MAGRVRVSYEPRLRRQITVSGSDDLKAVAIAPSHLTSTPEPTCLPLFASPCCHTSASRILPILAMEGFVKELEYMVVWV